MESNSKRISKEIEGYRNLVLSIYPDAYLTSVGYLFQIKNKQNVLSWLECSELEAWRSAWKYYSFKITIMNYKEEVLKIYPNAVCSEGKPFLNRYTHT